ncbi:Protein CBG07907 [Caenorhabditis briggsae]|uniref:Protein CBG07907 n=1 Tax=Caenorhabditis briggsae TaxID=6238 RepID=A8X560_CAEBR|nr:Protein CBG07907 [Caenorhabditis briggsae]CAP27835.2 Protein CBG07907 [Caenorhabditis briggsae]
MGALLFSALSPIFIFFISLSVIGRTSPVGSSRPRRSPCLNSTSSETTTEPCETTTEPCLNSTSSETTTEPCETTTEPCLNSTSPEATTEPCETTTEPCLLSTSSETTTEPCETTTEPCLNSTSSDTTTEPCETTTEPCLNSTSSETTTEPCETTTEPCLNSTSSDTTTKPCETTTEPCLNSTSSKTTNEPCETTTEPCLNSTSSDTTTEPCETTTEPCLNSTSSETTTEPCETTTEPCLNSTSSDTTTEPCETTTKPCLNSTSSKTTNEPCETTTEPCLNSTSSETYTEPCETTTEPCLNSTSSETTNEPCETTTEPCLNSTSSETTTEPCETTTEPCLNSTSSDTTTEPCETTTEPCLNSTSSKTTNEPCETTTEPCLNSTSSDTTTEPCETTTEPCLNSTSSETTTEPCETTTEPCLNSTSSDTTTEPCETTTEPCLNSTSSKTTNEPYNDGAMSKFHVFGTTNEPCETTTEPCLDSTFSETTTELCETTTEPCLNSTSSKTTNEPCETTTEPCLNSTSSETTTEPCETTTEPCLNSTSPEATTEPCETTTEPCLLSTSSETTTEPCETTTEPCLNSTSSDTTTEPCETTTEPCLNSTSPETTTEPCETTTEPCLNSTRLSKCAPSYRPCRPQHYLGCLGAGGKARAHQSIGRGWAAKIPMNSRRSYGHPPMDRRSRSSSAHLHQPYHAISEVYTKEITHRPIAPASEYPPEVIQILREEPRAPRMDPERTYTPPLIRSRGNTWTTENFPIVRVPSAQFTDIMTEVYDYHEVNEVALKNMKNGLENQNFQKFTRRSVSPDVLIRQEDVPKAPILHVIPPTPEKNTPRYGIPLTTSEFQKPLPMYEEYVRMQKDKENRNLITTSSESRSSEFKDSECHVNNNLRHIDSSSSESSESFQKTSSEIQNRPEDVRRHQNLPEDVGKRYVYSHDVYVDSTTGRPYTPGSEELRDRKNCDKLKINATNFLFQVYFTPPHPPVEATYKLDEIEIEKHEDIYKLRPSRSATILSANSSSNPSFHPEVSTENPQEMSQNYRRIPTSTSILRKEHEILTVPLNRSQSARQSRISEHSTRRSASKTITERSIPVNSGDTVSINMDEIFPKMTNSTVTRIPETRGSIDKSDYPRRVPSVVPSHPRRQETPELQFTRKLSKTPSVQEYKTIRAIAKFHFISRSIPKVGKVCKCALLRIFENISSFGFRSPSEVRIPVTVAHGQQNRPIEKRQSPEELDYGRFPENRNVKDLPYTRGVSKTPSDKTERRELMQPNPIHRQDPLIDLKLLKNLEISKGTVTQDYSNPVKNISGQRGRLNYSIPEEFPRRQVIRTTKERRVHLLRFIFHTIIRKKREPTKKLKIEADILRNASHQDGKYSIQNYSNPQKSLRTQSPSKPRNPPSASDKTTHSAPYEEIVHIKERYERDETIRRFFPTTTTV